MLEENYEIITEACSYVMEDLNKAARIGLKPVIPEFDTERAENTVIAATNSNGTKPGSKGAQLVENTALSTVDDFVRINADFHKEAGFNPKIERIFHGGPCTFCQSLQYSGDYKAPEMPDGIFKRHRDCRCTVIFFSRKGKYQDVWSKQESSDYQKVIKEQRKHLTQLDKMTPQERRLVRNKRTRDLRRNKYTESEWAERKSIQSQIAQNRAQGKEYRKITQEKILQERAFEREKRAMISSNRSDYKKYLEGVKKGQRELKKRQQFILDKIPEAGNWEIFKTNEIHIRDLAALTAKTGREFACFTKGNKTIVIHGGSITWSIPDEALEEIMKKQYTWKAHSHPTLGNLIASDEDINTLKLFTWQKKSIIIDLNGKSVEFDTNMQNWFNKVLGIK